MDEHAKIPKCNLAESVHNKWLQQYKNKMTCLYKATMDDSIYAFMQIINYKSRWRGSFTGKGFNFASLKLKVPARCGNPKPLANAMKSYLGAEDLYTRIVLWRDLSFLDLPNENMPSCAD